MFPGSPRLRTNFRVVPVGSISTLILCADDPDTIIYEAFNTLFSGTTVTLPNTCSVGKIFNIFLTTNAVTNPTIGVQYIDIIFPSSVGGQKFIWRLYSGQRPKFTYTENGWVSDAGGSSLNTGVTCRNDLAVGNSANGSSNGSAFGYSTNAFGSGAAFGMSANGSAAGAAFGYAANGSDSGVAFGYSAVGINYGVGLGRQSNGSSYGTAIGYLSIGSSNSVAVGDSTYAIRYSVAIGSAASADTSGVALGTSSIATASGVSVGSTSNGSGNGVALGYGCITNGKDSAVTMGYQTTAQRYREFVKSADNAVTTLRSFSILDWYGDTTNATQTEIFLGMANQRAIVLASSAIAFKLLVIARDNVNNVVSAWHILGAIKRDATNNTAIVGSVTSTLIAQDAAATTWDIAVSADDTNEALAIKVTGAAATTIRWNVRGDISELRF